MATAEECVDHARECVRLAGLAGLAGDHEMRDRFLDMSRGWMTAALEKRWADASAVERLCRDVNEVREKMSSFESRSNR